MTTPFPSSEILDHAAVRGVLGTLRGLFGGRVHGLRHLDERLMRDIGASGDDIWHVHRLRNGERPTLLVG
jgi:hypothetical protein